MWNEYTPPNSPGYAEDAFLKPRFTKTRSTLMKERSSTYYADLASRTRQAETVSGSELEHGWAATANALHVTSRPSLVKHGLPVPPLPAHHGNASLAELVAIDNKENSPGEWEEQAAAAEPRMNIRWTLFACLGLTRRGMPKDHDTPISEKRPSLQSSTELQVHRDARHKFLAKRQARGSIMYDKESGVAQIPLYAAPRAAQVAGAPALSSFAPRPPLAGQAKRASWASWTSQAPVSKASATVDADGNVISVNKRQSYTRDKGRFSRFLDADHSHPLPPLPPLPHQYKP